MWETAFDPQVGKKIPLEEGMATCSSTLAWKNLLDWEGYSPLGPKSLDAEQLSRAKGELASLVTSSLSSQSPGCWRGSPG